MDYKLYNISNHFQVNHNLVSHEKLVFLFVVNIRHFEIFPYIELKFYIFEKLNIEERMIPSPPT